MFVPLVTSQHQFGTWTKKGHFMQDASKYRVEMVTAWKEKCGDATISASTSTLPGRISRLC
jgi:hypothetical protein